MRINKLFFSLILVFVIQSNALFVQAQSRTLRAAAEKRGWKISEEREALGNKNLAENGMSIIEPDAGMKAAFTKIGETMLAEWIKKAGPDGEALIKAYRAK